MKVLGVFSAYDTPNPGGVQESGRLAWEAIAERSSGFDARALFVSLEDGKDTATDPRVRVARGRVGAAIAARRIGFKPDAVLFWHLDLLKLAPLLRLPRTCKRVVFLHGIEAWRKQGSTVRRLLRSVDVVLTNTTSTYKRALQHNPELAGKHTALLHLGVGSPFHGTIPEPDEVPAAIMIARLNANERYKGHDEVIAAWPLVQQRVPRAQLWIVGDGDLLLDLEESAASADVQDSVRFFGRVSDAEKATLLQRARCLLLPSTGEGFGLVYLEAMRVGRPCLCGIDGGREVINPPEAGYSVTHRSPQELADAIVRLLTLDDAWRAQSVAARSRYEQTFTSRHFGERIVSALREAAR